MVTKLQPVASVTPAFHKLNEYTCAECQLIHAEVHAGILSQSVTPCPHDSTWAVMNRYNAPVHKKHVLACLLTKCWPWNRCCQQTLSVVMGPVHAQQPHPGLRSKRGAGMQQFCSRALRSIRRISTGALFKTLHRSCQASMLAMPPDEQPCISACCQHFEALHAIHSPSMETAASYTLHPVASITLGTS
jgi:hypothetical protein